MACLHSNLSVFKSDLSDAFAFHGKLTLRSFHSAIKKTILLRVSNSDGSRIFVSRGASMGMGAIASSVPLNPPLVLKSANRSLVTLNCFKFEVSDYAESNGGIYY